MGLQFQPQSFSSLAEALDDVRESGAWPTTLVGGPSPGRPVHWHDHDVTAYVIEGETDFLDGESGVRTPVRAGDKVIVPAGALHAEGPIASRVVYLITTLEPMEYDRFLKQREPDTRPVG